MIAALLLTGTVPSFAAKNKKTYTTPEGTVYPLEKTTILEGIPEDADKTNINKQAGKANK